MDDGSHFKLWRDQVLVKFFSSYGMIIALNIFIMLTSLVIDPNLHFFEDSFLNFCIKVLVILGSALGLNRSMGLVGNLISSGAGSNEFREAAATRGAFMNALSMPLKPATAIAKEALHQKKRDIASRIIGSGQGGKDGAAGKNGAENNSSTQNDSNQNTNSPNYNNNKKGVSLAIADNFGMNDSADGNKDNNGNKEDDNKNDNKPEGKGKNLVTLAITNTGNGGGNL